MQQAIQLKTTIPPGRNSSNRSPWRGGLFLIALTLALFGLSPTAQAVTPAPDGGYPDFNTAEGDDALFSLTTGVGNTAIGTEALFSNTEGNFNTAIGVALLNNTTASNNTATGAGALFSNTTIGVNSGDDNTATGFAALFSNTTGTFNTASGSQALGSNTTGVQNTANGYQALALNTGSHNTATGFHALFSNTNADNNTAYGYEALLSNTGPAAMENTAVGFRALRTSNSGVGNTAIGYQALQDNTTGLVNTAVGDQALFHNNGGSFNTAYGAQALFSNTTGSSNIALGTVAGNALTIGDDNIDIGNSGAAGESRTIRIGNSLDHDRTFIAGIRGKTTGSMNTLAVLIDVNGQLGTASSSRRFKKEIKPMEKTSEAILALKPVTFHYKSDTTSTPQFGLIAEEVAEVNPDLVVRDENGEIYTVRYEAVNAMLLNEFLKEHRKVEEQEATITQLKSAVAQQQEGMKVFAATLKEQASQIQKVSAQLELSKPAPQTVLSNQ